MFIYSYIMNKNTVVGITTLLQIYYCVVSKDT